MLTIRDEEEPLFKRNLFERDDVRETTVYGKIFRIYECTNTDVDYLEDNSDGNNNFDELIGIGIGFELFDTQNVAIFANVEEALFGEGMVNVLYGNRIKIVVDGVDDTTSQRNWGWKYPAPGEMHDEKCFITSNTQTKQTLNAGYHRASIRFLGEEPSPFSDIFGKVLAAKSNLIVIIGG